jgi:2-C-methyl-D-erythritol 4-phosphate cytidylyltransferase
MKIALLTAAGVGNRMQQEIPKQFMQVEGKAIIVHTLEVFQKAAEIDVIAVACLAGWEENLAAYAKQHHITKLKHIVPGGKNGQSSIRNVLFELEKHYKPRDIVLIHDGVRPLVSQEIISDCLVVTEKYGNAIASIPTIEAICYSEDTLESEHYYDRDKLQRTQTPHGFYLADILDLHRRALATGIDNSVAACTMAIDLGEKIHFSLGSEKNLKITRQEDIDIFRALLMLQGK